MSSQEITWRDALLVECAQAVSLIPGTSRSGITITAVLLLKLSREAAARFSFLLAIPITALAASVKLIEMITSTAKPLSGLAFLVGGTVSFLTAWLALHYFFKYLDRFRIWPYVLYRLVLAAVLYSVSLA